MALDKGKYTIIDLTKLKNRKIACLTLDLEQDYGDLLDEPSYEGLSHIDTVVSLFRERGIPLTCFVQGSLFETHPSAIEKLSALDIEFEVHTYSHPKPKEIDHEFEIGRGKEAFAKFWGREPIAYRSPAGVVDEKMFSILPLYGFKFDSSVIPSVRPGVFNSLNKPIVPYLFNDSGMAEFPVTVFSRLIRIPISLSYVKLLGKPYFYLLRSSKLPNLIIFSFHLHDLSVLSSSDRLPIERAGFIYKRVFSRIYQKGGGGLPTLSRFIELLQDKGYTFMKLVDVYEAVVAS